MDEAGADRRATITLVPCLASADDRADDAVFVDPPHPGHAAMADDNTASRVDGDVARVVEVGLLSRAVVAPVSAGTVAGDPPDDAGNRIDGPDPLVPAIGQVDLTVRGDVHRFDAVEESAGCQPAVVDARAAKERGDDAVGAIVTPRAPGAVAPDDGAVGVGPDAALHRVAAGHRSV